MTLNEAIARLNDKHNHTLVFNPKQLARFLTELKELREENEKLMSHACDLQLAYNNELIDGKKAKRLLKAAVEDLNATATEVYNGGVICECCKWESQIGKCSCPDDGGCDTDYQWRYADEALKLIGED